jgi:hypothetical protein
MSDDEITAPRKRVRSEPSPLPPPGEYLRVIEAAAVLRLRQSAMELLLDGDPPAIPSARFPGSRHRLVRRSDIDAYVRKHLSGSGEGEAEGGGT